MASHSLKAWEEEKRKREMEEKEIKYKEFVEIENERYKARTKLEEARLEAIRTVENGKGNRSCHPYKHLIIYRCRGLPIII